jgi:hypothetical protein
MFNFIYKIQYTTHQPIHNRSYARRRRKYDNSIPAFIIMSEINNEKPVRPVVLRLNSNQIIPES